MADKYKNSTFADYTVNAGTVQMAFPKYGCYVIRTNLAGAPKYVYVNAPQQGNYAGCSVSQTLQPGTKVQFVFDPNDTNRGSLVSVSIDEDTKYQDMYRFYRHLYYTPEDPDRYRTPAIDRFMWNEFEELTHHYQTPAISKIIDQVLPGDFCISNDSGLQLFIGQSLMSLKTGSFSYIQLSSITRSITVFSALTQIDTLTTQLTYTSGIDKYYKAYNLRQSIGALEQKLYVEEQQQTEQNKDAKAYNVFVNATDSVTNPLYRLQKLSGGELVGQYITIVQPIEIEQNIQHCTLLCDYKTKHGTQIKSTATSFKQIKSPNINGLVRTEIDRETYQNIAEVDKDYKQKAKQDKKIQKDLISDIKHLVLQQLLNTSLSPFIQNYIDTPQMLDTLNKQQICLGTAIAQVIKFKEAQKKKASSISQYMQLPEVKKANEKDIYNNTSFISQEQDGSILIKDGWGSEIRMSRGNIYISSALDTFIQPGRDCIQLVPRHKSITANGEITQVASKRALFASQANAIVTSGISGGAGYTVLQNRSNKQNKNLSGMILRSNSKLTLTSSDDMYIGINDKSSSNAKDKATKGTGNIVLEATNLVLDAQQTTKLTASSTCIYSITGSSASGIEIIPGNISLISPQVQAAASYLSVGATSSIYTNTRGITQNTFTVSQGSTGSTTTFRINGNILARNILMSGQLQNTGTIIAQDYMTLQQKELKQIPGTKKDSASKIKNNLYKITGQAIKGNAIKASSIILDWYNDSYICKQEATFLSSAQMSFTPNFKLPLCCWQLNPLQQTHTFTFIQTTSTGEQTITSSYPGKEALSSGKLIRFNIQKMGLEQLQISENYITNSPKETE